MWFLLLIYFQLCIQKSEKLETVLTSTNSLNKNRLQTKLYTNTRYKYISGYCNDFADFKKLTSTAKTAKQDSLQGSGLKNLFEFSPFPNSQTLLLLFISSLLLHSLEVFSPISSFPGGSDNKESACNAGDLGSIPWLGRSPGEGKGYPLQYSCLENPMD